MNDSNEPKINTAGAQRLSCLVGDRKRDLMRALENNDLDSARVELAKIDALIEILRWNGVHEGYLKSALGKQKVARAFYGDAIDAIETDE